MAQLLVQCGVSFIAVLAFAILFHAPRREWAPCGLTGMVEMLGNSGDRWLEDMASWTHQPDNWAQVAQPGVNQEMANFPDYIGHTNAECIAYRDQMLIDILKLHKKL